MSMEALTPLRILGDIVPGSMRLVERTGNSSPSDHPVMKGRAAYTATQKEFYLSSDQLAFARPGITYKINSVTIGADRKPVIDVTITDAPTTAGALAAPVDRNGIQTPGLVTASFVLSWYEPTTRNYTSYATRIATAAAPADPSRIGNTAVQATGLSGTITDLELGHFKFNSSTVLPVGFDQTKTHTIAVYRRPTMPPDIMNGTVYIDNFDLAF